VKSAAKAVVTEEETEFAEDRFHRKDASSSYLINQREQARKDKWDKHEKYACNLFILSKLTVRTLTTIVIIFFLVTVICREKAERANDPNVEYVDMDDFRCSFDRIVLRYGCVKISRYYVRHEVAGFPRRISCYLRA
jgi:hypothetical protein